MTERARARFDAGRAIALSPPRPETACELQAVVLPMTYAQRDEAQANFRAWGELTPLAPGQAPFADLIVVVNNATADELGQLRDLAAQSSAVNANFRTTSVLSAGLAGADDAYDIGDATGANNLFFFALGALSEYSTFLLMETDCQPMRPAWLSDAAACVRTQMGTKWILGAQYRGGGNIGEAFWRHINGNAFYRSGSPAFQTFYRDEFLPFYGDRYDNHGFRFGYDAAHELFLGEHPDRQRARMLLSKFGHTDFIVNLRTHDDDSGVPRGEGFEGVLWHRGGWMKRAKP